MEAEKRNGDQRMEEATFGAGCFWCVEAVFENLKGVLHVESAFSGGNIKNPAYREVREGRTFHVEVIRIQFDPHVILFKKLLEIFFQMQDTNTVDQQGADKGNQYRSVIFYHNNDQKEQAGLAKEAVIKSGIFLNEVVTGIEKLKNYFKAEVVHQHYFARNGDDPYCALVIRPKLDKFREMHTELLKEETQIK